MSLRGKQLLTDVLQGLRSAPMRTTLCATTVAIGIAGTAMSFALGAGLERLMTTHLQADASETVTIRIDRIQAKGGTLASDAIAELVARQPGVRATARVAELEAPWTQIAGVAGPLAGRVMAVESGYPAVANIHPAQGRFLADADNAQQRAVAVIGAEVARRAIGGRNPIGERLAFGTKGVRVVGVLAQDRAINEFLSRDRFVFIPYRVAAQANAAAVERSTAVMAALAGVTPSLRRAFETALQDAVNRRAQRVLPIRFTWESDARANLRGFAQSQSQVLVFISALTLLVAGVSMTNIFFVSVAERRAEIGIRKAVGATASEIGALVLSESVTMAVLGAVAGLVVAYVLGPLLPQIAATLPTPVFEAWITAVSLAIAVVVALVFAGVPAWFAARQNPVDAIRSGGK